MSRTLINIGECKQEIQQEDNCSTDITSDSKYLLKENNLADIPDTKKARENLDIDASNIPYNSYDTVESAITQLYKRGDSKGSITITPSIAEKGETVEECTITWSLPENPGSQILVVGNNTINLNQNDRSYTYSKQLSKTTDIKLITPTNTYSTTLSFIEGIYYGVCKTNPTIYQLSLDLNDTNKGIFEVDAKQDQYIYLLLPSDNAEISVNGIVGGFKNIDNTYYIDKYNSNYNLYRSENSTLGKTKVVWQYT